MSSIDKIAREGGVGLSGRFLTEPLATRCAQPDSAGEVEIIPTTHADAHQSAAVSFIAILITLPFVIRFATFRIADLMFVKAAWLRVSLGNCRGQSARCDCCRHGAR